MKMEVEVAMKKYKISLDFALEKAHVVAIFWASKEFFDNCVMLSQEAFEKGHELSKLECRA